MIDDYITTQKSTLQHEFETLKTLNTTLERKIEENRIRLYHLSGALQILEKIEKHLTDGDDGGKIHP